MADVESVDWCILLTVFAHVVYVVRCVASYYLSDLVVD